MFSVVGCRACEALWVVEGRPETTGCPRCGRRHRFDRLRRLAETDDEDAARQARAELLAERSGHGDALAELDPFWDLDDHVDEPAVTDEEYLAAAGLDPDAVRAAGERAGARPRGSGSRVDLVRAGLETLDAPTRPELCAFAAERDVPAEAAEAILTRLVESGEVTEDGGRYRLL